MIQRNVALIEDLSSLRPSADSLQPGTIFAPTDVDRLDVVRVVGLTRSWSSPGTNPHWYNVTDYGAVGDGNSSKATANVAAIQAAIDAIPSTGGTLYFPPGVFYINSAIVLKSYVRMLGAGVRATTIRQSSSSADAFLAADTLQVAIEDLSVIGPAGGTGTGFYFTFTSQVTSYLTMRNVNVQTFGNHGIHVERCIVTIMDKVVSQNHGGRGFLFDRATSTTFISTYALSCGQAGYDITAGHYCAFIATASDSCGLGYRITGSRCVSWVGCGTESCHNNTSTYNGTGLLIDSSIACTVNGFENVDNGGVAFRVTNTSTNITLDGLRENTPNVNATVSLQVDAASTVTLGKNTLVTAASIATGTAVFPSSTLFARRTTTQTVNNSATLVDDDTLTVSVEASATYILQMGIIYDSGTTPDIKFAFIGPTSATLDWTTNALGTAAAGGTGSLTVTRSTIGSGGVLPAGGIGAGSQVFAEIQGILVTSTTAGTFKLQWAQNTADPTDTIVRANSWMRLIRVQ